MNSDYYLFSFFDINFFTGLYHWFLVNNASNRLPNQIKNLPNLSCSFLYIHRLTAVFHRLWFFEHWKEAMFRKLLIWGFFFITSLWLTLKRKPATVFFCTCIPYLRKNDKKLRKILTSKSSSNSYQNWWSKLKYRSDDFMRTYISRFNWVLCPCCSFIR